MSYLPIFSISVALGIYLFFGNPWLSVDYYSESYGWFVEFSRTIFQPQGAYYAESILLPLIGKLSGASKSIIFYKSLCALITILILPILGFLVQRRFQSFYKALVFVIIFGMTYSYLKFFILGFPDPLTIILLLSTIFQRKIIYIFVLAVLALLSHFSMSIIAIAGLLAMVLACSDFLETTGRKFCGALLSAIIVSKFILLGWYWLFHYQLQTRLSWATEKGYSFFYERYLNDVLGFWLTPGSLFLTAYFLMNAYFLVQRRFSLVAAAIFSLALSYLALFWTVDGLRVFAVIISAPYGYLLTGFIQSISAQIAVLPNQNKLT